MNMKNFKGRSLLTLFLLFLPALIILSTTSISQSTIVTSKHDLSVLTGGGSFQSDNEDEICIFCHTPHNAIVVDSDLNRLPLWNRSIGRNESGFTVYASTTLNATPGQPRSMTLLCLSCHDGVTAFNSLINYGQVNPITMYGGTGADQFGDVCKPGDICYKDNIGGAYPGGGENIKDLSNDHPVSFVFDNSLVLADGDLKLPPAGDRVKLFNNNRLECASCHNVHEEGLAANGDFPFLRKSNDQSALCTTCHLK